MNDNVALSWNNAALEAVRRTRMGPPMVARALHVLHASIYDAWAAHDAQAFGSRLGDELRRPAAGRNQEAKREAVSFAGHRALSDLFPTEATAFAKLMSDRGYDPDAVGPAGSPSAVGVGAARAVLVVPFALEAGWELGPRRRPGRSFLFQAEQVLADSAGLTDEHKAIAEYWADGPGSETPPGHWCLHAQHVSAWGGPGLGPRRIRGEDWQPYIPTPPFGEYPSGHSTFSAAAAAVLTRFTGSARFGASVTIGAGSSRIEPGTTPAADVTLSWPTFADASDQAGRSRRYGGIHFKDGDLVGRAIGCVVGARVWEAAAELFAGRHHRAGRPADRPGPPILRGLGLRPPDPRSSGA